MLNQITKLTRPKIKTKTNIPKINPKRKIKVKSNPNKYCGYCGHRFNTTKFPLNCKSCKRKTYKNAEPVVLGIVKYKITDDEDDDKLGILLVRRNYGLYKGGWCIPGGYVDYGQTWEEAVRKEIKEETGIIIPECDEINHVKTISTHDKKKILIFGMINKIYENISDLNKFKPNDEISEIMIGKYGMKLCYDFHQEIFDKLLKQKE